MSAARRTCCAAAPCRPRWCFGHSGFLHQVQGIRPPGGVRLFHYAADLARAPNGRWWVVNDRTQAPSGAGCAFANRLVVARVFPQMFRDLHVQHLASLFDMLRASLLQWAPKGETARHFWALGCWRSKGMAPPCHK